MPDLKIFVSFEFDEDSDLKNTFFQQAKEDTSHRILNSSLNEAYPDHEWKDKARSAIRGCDIVIVLVGQDTHNAPGVKTEVEIALRLKKPVLQVVPQGRSYTGVPDLDQSIPWRWKRINQKINELWTQKQRG